MSFVHYGICNFCDSSCGIEIEHDGKNIIAIRGDKQNPFSRGHICPKGLAQQDIHDDPDRLRKPVKRKGKDWEEISWEEAYEEAGSRIGEIQKRYGLNSVGVYYGNPISHNYAGLLCLLPFVKGFKTRNLFSATSVDSLTRMLVSLWLYGSQAVLPVPDISRTNFLLIIGANPLVSHGSVMTAPDTKSRLMEVRKRGGKIIVIDPRRTETAAIADTHYFIKPGSDAMFLLAMMDTMFKENLIKPGKVASMIDNLDVLRNFAEDFSPDRVAKSVGIAAQHIKSLAREFASAPSAVCYGRMGTSTQEFGSVATWLVDVLNIITGNLDRPGGYMFATPAVDLAGLAKLLRQPGFFNRWKSRVGGLPEFNGEFPVAALAEEMETPGSGQIKSFVTLTGNPVLSLPNGRRLDRAFEKLEFMISIDHYINETTRHANIVLPPTSSMETDHYPVLELAMGVRNFAFYGTPVLEKAPDAKHLWEIQLDLLYHVEKNRGALSSVLAKIKRSVLRFFTPQIQLNLLLKFGPQKLSIEKLKQAPHGLDLGSLESRLDKVLNTPSKRINLAPKILTDDLDRLKRKFDETRSPEENQFSLISRRTMRSMNSWLHNSPRLVSGPDRCTLMMNPADAQRCGFQNGEMVKMTSRVGEISAPLEVTDQMMPGVVSMPYGWGHNREGAKMSVAKEHPGVSMNDVTDESLFDRVCGISVLDGIPVTVTKVD